MIYTQIKLQGIPSRKHNQVRAAPYVKSMGSKKGNRKKGCTKVKPDYRKNLISEL